MKGDLKILFGVKQHAHAKIVTVTVAVLIQIKLAIVNNLKLFTISQILHCSVQCRTIKAASKHAQFCQVVLFIRNCHKWITYKVLNFGFPLILIPLIVQTEQFRILPTLLF